MLGASCKSGWCGWPQLFVPHFFRLVHSLLMCPLLRQRRQHPLSLTTTILWSSDFPMNDSHWPRRWSPLHSRQMSFFTLPPGSCADFGFDCGGVLEETGCAIALMVGFELVLWSVCRLGFDPGFGLTGGTGAILNWQCLAIISPLTKLLRHAAKSWRLRQTGCFLTICLPHLLCTSDGSLPVIGGV